MILIQKSAEPKSLTEYKKQPFANYDGCDKESIKESLLKEQGYICAYCMKRIKDVQEMTIEHYKPQNPQDATEDNQKDKLDYSNMLGVCLGNRGNPKKVQTCDAHRGNTPLTVNPFIKTSIDKIAYSSDGRIYSDDVDINTDLNDTLNLNCEYSYLIHSRKQALDILRNFLYRSQPQGQW
jgi:uncharacterized protein (TIGR02646 family)